MNGVLLIGIVFIAVGLLLRRTTPYGFGVRTPWTLASEAVWRRTHGLASALAIVVGLLIVIAHFIAPPDLATAIAIAGSVAASVASVVYSYLTWKREQSR